MTPGETVLAFVHAIDSHDYAGLEALCAPGHRFVLNGRVIDDPAQVRALWEGWWSLVPEFTTGVEELHEIGGLVVLVMTPRGTHVVRDGRRINQAWSLPVAVFARVEGGRVVEWREFCDAAPVKSIGL